MSSVGGFAELPRAQRFDDFRELVGRDAQALLPRDVALIGGIVAKVIAPCGGSLNKGQIIGVHTNLLVCVNYFTTQSKQPTNNPPFMAGSAPAKAGAIWRGVARCVAALARRR